MVKAIRRWLRSVWLWVLPGVTVPMTAVEVAAVLAQPEGWTPSGEPWPAPGPKVSHATDNLGSLYFRGNILEHLDGYFRDLRRLKRMDLDTYLLYARLGAQVANDHTYYGKALEPAWLKQRPAFGATYMNLKPDGSLDEHGQEYIPLNLVYYRKSKKFSAIEAISLEEDMYEIGFFYKDEKAKLKHNENLLATVYVGVNKHGKVRALKQRVNNCRRTHGGVRWHKVVEELWGKQIQKLGVTPEEWMQDTFAIVTSVTINATAGIQVLVRSGGLTARFNIDMLRGPYFFRDRDKVLGPEGQTRRIFHIVRAHERFKGEHREVVHTHFRGLRDFTWNGYGVHISVPGLHHVPLTEFNVASQVGKLGPGKVSVSEMAPILLHEPDAGRRPYHLVNGAH